MSIFPKILLAADGSEDDARRAVEMAIGLSTRLHSELHLVYVAHEHPYLPAYYDLRHQEDKERFRTEDERALDAYVDQVRKARGTVAKSHIRAGHAAKEIVELAEESGSGLVVLGSRGRGRIRRALMGGVSAGVLRHAHCSVLVARGHGHPEEGRGQLPDKILVAIDGSEDAAAAARAATEIATAMGSEVHVAYAMQEERYRPHLGPEMWEGWEEGFERAKRLSRLWVEGQAERMRGEGVETVEAHPLLGRPDAAIVWLADDIGASQVVVGSRGLRGMKRTLIGSVSDSVARHAYGPVMVVRKQMRWMARAAAAGRDNAPTEFGGQPAAGLAERGAQGRIGCMAGRRRQLTPQAPKKEVDGVHEPQRFRERLMFGKEHPERVFGSGELDPRTKPPAREKS